ncbi:MAG TPA: ABC transporter ATP-binding protein [Coriobacteriia bacterium]
MLQAADVSFAYRASDPILRGVSMEVADGDLVGILGPNGSGKTTMLRVLSGTLKPSSGRVTLDGVDFSHSTRAAIARRMAVVPQETHLAFDYTALEVVLMGRYPHLSAFEIEGPADMAIARDALAATGTLAFEDRPFETLSGGEKQRVVIAAALAQIHSGRSAAPAHAVLLLDEPTAALDLAYQLEIASLLRALQQRRPMAIVISTHDLNFAAGLCRSLVLLKQGRVIAAGATGDVLTPDRIRALYGVEADVQRHGASGRLVVIPTGRSREGAER